MKKYLEIVLLSILLLAFCTLLAVMVFIRVEAQPAAPAPTAKPVATPVPTPTPTPEPEYFTLSFIGDNTLSSSNINSSFTSTLNGDMKYPYSNTLKYFENDDMTFANLECTFSDKTLYSNEMFAFKSPSSYAEILVNGSVEFVTLANNHINDFGSQGYSDTCEALDKYEINHCGNDETAIYETESGLKIGIYCADNKASAANVTAGIEKLKEEGAEYIVCAMHWGTEGTYHPTDSQVTLAHAAIDAGANIVYGSHPHVLQPVEEYNGGTIFYSLGNWSFGGNTNPKDSDTAIVQVTVKRDFDGTITTDAIDYIPCSMSSNSGYNDFRPTPYEEDSDDYNRTMSKLQDKFEGGDLNVDYSFLNN